MSKNYYGILKGYSVEDNVVKLVAIRNRVYTDEMNYDYYSRDEIFISINDSDTSKITKILEFACDEYFFIEDNTNDNQYRFELEDYFESVYSFSIIDFSVKILEYTLNELKEMYHQLKKKYYNDINVERKEIMKINKNIQFLRNSLVQDYNNSCKKVNYFKSKNSQKTDIEIAKNETYSKVLSKMDVFFTED